MHPPPDGDDSEKTQRPLLPLPQSPDRDCPGTPRSQIIGAIPGDTASVNYADGSVVDGSAAVSTRVKLQYLAVYFAVNLGLTMYNKVVMGKVGL